MHAAGALAVRPHCHHPGHGWNFSKKVGGAKWPIDWMFCYPIKVLMPIKVLINNLNAKMSANVAVLHGLGDISPC